MPAAPPDAELRILPVKDERRRWMSWEDDLLRIACRANRRLGPQKHRTKLPRLAHLAARLGRTYAAVRKRAQVIGAAGWGFRRGPETRGRPRHPFPTWATWQKRRARLHARMRAAGLDPRDAGYRPGAQVKPRAAVGRWSVRVDEGGTVHQLTGDGRGGAYWRAVGSVSQRAAGLPAAR